MIHAAVVVAALAASAADPASAPSPPSIAVSTPSIWLSTPAYELPSRMIDWGRVSAMAFNGIFPEEFRRFFDRDPERKVPPEPRVLVAPADGVVLDLVAHVSSRTLVISIGFGDVHVQRVPMDGLVHSLAWAGQGALPVSMPAHFGNVRRVTRLRTEIGEIEVVQITGLWTSRIQNPLRPGQRVRRGERLGRILLGSTATLTVPRNVRFVVNRYDRVVGGETIVGRY